MGFDVENQMDLAEGMSLYEIQADVLNDFHQRGFIIPVAPQQNTDQGPQPYRGDLPPDLTQLDDQTLGTLLTMLTRWLEYVGTQLTLTDLSRTVSGEQRDFTEATIKLTYKFDDDQKKRTVQERMAKVTTDRRYAKVNRAYIYLNTLYTLTEGVYKAAKQNYAAVSRRVTQRGQEIDRNNRTGAVGQLPAPGAPLLPGRRL